MGRKDRALAEMAEHLTVAGTLLTSLVMKHGAGVDGERVVFLADEETDPSCGVFISKTDGGWTLTAHTHEEGS